MSARLAASEGQMGSGLLVQHASADVTLISESRTNPLTGGLLGAPCWPEPRSSTRV